MMRKKSKWSAWYNLANWQHRRKYQLMLKPLCEQCEREGRLEPATVVDHVIPHCGDYNKFRLGKLQSLCDRCHNSTKKLVEAHGFDTRIGADGMPTDRRHPIYRYERE